MAFGNLTVDFRQLVRVPVRDRAALARSAQASEIFGNLTPSQIAALFPDYYKKFIPQASSGGGMAAGMTGAGFTGTGISTATSTAPTTPAGPTRPGYIEELFERAGPPPTSSPGGNFTPRERTVLNFIAKREGSADPNIVFGGQKYVTRLGLDKKPLTERTISEVINEVMPQLRQLSKADGYGITPGGQVVGTSAVGTGQMIEGTLRSNLAALGIPEKDWDKIKFDKTLQERLTLQNFKSSGIGDANADPSTWNMNQLANQYESLNPAKVRNGRMTQSEIEEIRNASPARPEPEPTVLPGTAPIDPTAPASDTGIIPLQQGETTATVAPQLQSFDSAIFAQLDPRIQEYYKTATDDEKKQLESAISKLGTSGVQEIMQRHPKATAESVTGKVVAENMDTATNISEMVNQDPLAFWKQRNPQGARIDDLDVETLRTSMMAAMKLEADMAAQGKPKRVEIYGGESGVRTDPKLEGSKHGLSFKEALDIAIYDVDPNTGQKLKSKSGAYGNYANYPSQKHGGIDPEGYALYHEFGQNAELARIYLADQGDTNYSDWAVRQGGLFQTGAPWDFMHVDRSAEPGQYGVSTHANPVGKGSVALGFTESAIRELGIDPNTDAGKRLMTGVVERFGGKVPSKEAIVEAAKMAYGDKPRPKLSEDTAKIVQSTPEQPLTGTETQTQQQRPNDTTVIPLQQSTANTAPAMKLGGEMNFKEPNTVKESMSLVANGKEVAQFNKNEQVNVEDGKIKVQNEYDKRTKESQQRNDKGTPANQYSMRQTTTPETPRTFPDQVKYGIVPQSPSAKRQFETAQFGGYDHFSRRSHSS